MKLFQMIKSGASNTLTIVVILLAVICLLLVVPFLSIWAINTLAEQGGSEFYIQHGFWSYLAVFTIMMIMRIERSD